MIGPPMVRTTPMLVIPEAGLDIVTARAIGTPRPDWAARQRLLMTLLGQRVREGALRAGVGPDAAQAREGKHP